MSSQQTFNEMVDSLTGYEEQAVEDAFGDHITFLLNANPTKAARALVFVDYVRRGQDRAAAKKSVMELKISEVNDFFSDDVEEPMPEEPVTEQGKDD